MVSAFALHRPTDVVEAAQFLSEHPEDAAAYCGGTEIFQVMKLGLANFDHMVDLKSIRELRGITHQRQELRIGAAVTHREIESSELVDRHAPTLASMERAVGNIRVRSTGTLGGNLCFAEPHSDPGTFLLAWGAELELQGVNGKRRLSMSEFIVGPLETTREPDEILVAIYLPDLPRGTAVVHRKLAFVERPAATVACQMRIDESRIVDARVVVGSIGHVASLVTGAGRTLQGTPVAEAGDAIVAASEIAGDECEPVEDINGSEEYKKQLVRVLVRRTLTEALGQTGAAHD